MATVPGTGRRILPELLRSPTMPTLLIVSALAIGGAAVVPLVQSSIATTTNGNIHRLEQQRDDWQARIQELELDVATMAGLERIEQKARADLKMSEPNDTQYITVAAEPPEARKLPARYLPPAPDKTETEPSVWEQWLDWLPLP